MTLCTSCYVSVEAVDFFLGKLESLTPPLLLLVSLFCFRFLRLLPLIAPIAPIAPMASMSLITSISQSSSGSSDRRQMAKSHTAKILAQQEEKNTNFRRFVGDGGVRTQDFVVNLAFRNELPRVPVGARFLGGEVMGGGLGKEFVEYSKPPDIEREHAWRLHSELDCGVKIDTVSPECYELNTVDKLQDEDRVFVEWKGGMGDSEREELQKVREMRRRGLTGNKWKGRKRSDSYEIGLKDGKSFSESRILDRKAPEYMKRTTYLANDIHQKKNEFRSLTEVNMEKVKELDERIKTHAEASGQGAIDKSFAFANRPNRARMKHATKKNLTVEWIMPLLPDIDTWSHSLSHTDISTSEKNNKKQIKFASRSIVADVAVKESKDSGVKTQRMTCNLIAPAAPNAPTKLAREEYQVTQAYDLEVIPLRKEGEPEVHFLLRVSQEDGAVYYHPLNSKVNMSMPRPGPRIERRVLRREMTQEEKEDDDNARCDVDMGLAIKLGRVEEEDVEESGDVGAANIGANIAAGGQDDQDMQ